MPIRQHAKCSTTRTAKGKAPLSILAADKQARAVGSDLFAVKAALSDCEDLAGSMGHGIAATNDRV